MPVPDPSANLGFRFLVEAAIRKGAQKASKHAPLSKKRGGGA